MYVVVLFGDWMHDQCNCDQLSDVPKAYGMGRGRGILSLYVNCPGDMQTLKRGDRKPSYTSINSPSLFVYGDQLKDIPAGIWATFGLCW